VAEKQPGNPVKIFPRRKSAKWKPQEPCSLKQSRPEKCFDFGQKGDCVEKKSPLV
jgi:hypothetical protein